MRREWISDPYMNSLYIQNEYSQKFDNTISSILLYMPH